MTDAINLHRTTRKAVRVNGKIYSHPHWHSDALNDAAADLNIRDDIKQGTPLELEFGYLINDEFIVSDRMTSDIWSMTK